MSAPQSFKNHARWLPLFHFVVLPILLVNIGFAIYATIHNPIFKHRDEWWIVMSITIFFLALLSRMMALRAQDRLIRLEEKLRMASLFSQSELAEVESLTIRQYVALRFASNPELPELARRAVRENLSEKQIKQSIKAWRADDYRV